ncbi:MAG: putative Ig domain-containing protein [Candidatus Aminicenantes bacterium]|nr:putative Ig domain-containing protein [Candidatus Aminicenantes bacterium]
MKPTTRLLISVIILTAFSAGLAAEARVVLTPKPGPAPRINGAMIFGVRPGSPFLYTIAATGERPLTFAAEGLPDGLALDSATGRITGILADRGEYAVTLKATNALGAAERSFRIVCGDRLALTPHMGWNSWYVWENRVTDRIMREAADAMVASGMIDHGYQYVNIDDCWAVRPESDDPGLRGEPRDERGMINANRRFPDMKGLTDYIHAKGLKAGIYTSPGPQTCAGYTGSYGREELDVRRFVEWGFDFLKYDWCSYGRIAKDEKNVEELQKPYRLVSAILARQPRDIVLNLCQYGMGKVWEWGREVGGHSWRTAGDLGHDVVGNLFRDGFDVYADNGLDGFGGPGGWNDPDYLLVGILSSAFVSDAEGGNEASPLSPNEQYTHVSLWALLAAPLIFSGDITRLDDFTLGLLTNDEIIDVDQDPLGRPGRRAAKDGNIEVWVRELQDGSKAVGLFNRGPGLAEVVADWAAIGVEGPQKARDLWRQQDLGVYEGVFKAYVARHGVVMIRLWPSGR